MSDPTSTTSSSRAFERVTRFDLTQRVIHWVVAAMFAVLMVTALPLYFGSLFGVVLARHTVAQVHLWTGIALPVPVVISLIGPWGASMRRDARRVSKWTRGEIRWMRTLGREGTGTGKFNPGQKLNAIFIGAAIVIMVVTGSMLQWFSYFPVQLRTNATFVHDVGSFAIFVVVFGHSFMALTHPDALRSMVRGWVPRRWAEALAPRWLAEIDAQSADAPAATGEPPIATSASIESSTPSP